VSIISLIAVAANSLLVIDLNLVPELYRPGMWVILSLTLVTAAVAAIREAWLLAGLSAPGGGPNMSMPHNAAINGEVREISFSRARVEQGKPDRVEQGKPQVNVGQTRDDTTAQPSPEAQRLHRLPAGLANFIGHEQKVDNLLELLAQDNKRAKIAVIGGVGGVGKSTLAVHMAHRLVEDYPDAQIFVDLRGTSERPLTPAEAMAKVIHAFCPEAHLPDESAQVARFYRSVLAGKRALIVLDDAANAAQMLPLQPPPPCALIVTMRRVLTLPGLHTLTLGALPEDEAQHLLRTIVSKGRTTRTELNDIARLCGCLPLALRVAGAFLAVHPRWEAIDYTRILVSQRERLIWQNQESLEVQAALGFSATQLAQEQPDLAKRWQMLSVFPGSFDRAAAAAVWKVTVREARESLGELVRHSLLLYDAESDRHRLHDLVRPVARNAFAYGRRKSTKVEDQQRLEEAAARHAVHYETVIRTADQLYQQGGQAHERGLDQFDLEWENIQVGQAWAQRQAKESDVAAELCSAYADAGANLLSLRQHPQDQVRWREAALAAARRLQKRDTESVHLGNLGLAYAALGETNRAIEFHDQRLAIAREIDDRRGQGKALGNLGLAYAALGETNRAIEFYDQALALDREVGDRRSEGADLGNLGNAYFASGQTGRAIEFYDQALALDREVGDRCGEGVALGNLGNAYFASGQTDRSVELCEQGLAIFRELGDRLGEGHILGNLGNAYFASGQTHRAVELYEQALAIAREISDRRSEGVTLGDLGNAYFTLGEPRRAIEFCEQGLRILHEIGDLRSQGKTQNSLGLAYAASGEPRRAIEFCEQCLKIFRDIGDLRGEGKALFIMSLALANLGDRPQAIAQAEAALKIYEQTSNPNAATVRKQLDKWREKK
jgi:tetratricopeptide (TPR) repeat protein